MKVLITYDINNRHSDVKSELESKGFSDSWLDKNKNTYYLPNTTLWHDNINSTIEANRVFHETIESLNVGKSPDEIIKVERFIAIPATPWSGIPGNPHS
ncbi:MAG: hypothetical protein WED10_09460 [Brumimicrobium sp.]